MIQLIGWMDEYDGKHNLGYEVTTDGGATWTRGLMPFPDRSSAADASVAFDRSNLAYYCCVATIPGYPTRQTWVSWSTDQGLTWSDQQRTQVDPSTTWFADRPCVAVAPDANPESPYLGRVYVAYYENDFRINGQ